MFSILKNTYHQGEGYNKEACLSLTKMLSKHLTPHPIYGAGKNA
jgi:hypothetical protein